MSNNFEELRRKCLNSGRLFKDPDFQPSPNILGNESGHKNIIWKRPMEICPDPKFEVEGFSRYDVQQGYLGDCWFLAALAALAENKKLFQRVVPDDNDFGENYAGIFHFW
jgi:hypothetical protein